MGVKRFALWPNDMDGWKSITPAEVQALLAGGADVNTRDEHGATPLHMATRHNKNSEVIQALLAGGAKVNALDHEGRSPLYRAVEGIINPKIIRMLLDADVKVTDAVLGIVKSRPEALCEELIQRMKERKREG